MSDKIQALNIWLDCSKWALIVRIIVFYINTKQRPHLKEMLSTQMVRVILRMSVDLSFTSQSLFNQLMSKVAILEAEGLYMDFNSMALLGLSWWRSG